MKIVSLLPSATELLCELGLGENLVGVSHECDYPDFVLTLPKVTRSLIPKGTPSDTINALVSEQLVTEHALYHLDYDLLGELQPDFLVTQSLCEVCAVAQDEVMRAIQKLPSSPRAINLEPSRLSDVYATLGLIGRETQRQSAAQAAVDALKHRVARVSERTRRHLPMAHRPRVVFLEWLNPPFNAGHWTPELIEMAGGISLLDNRFCPSQALRWADIWAAAPDILFVACCGFDEQRTLVDIAALVGEMSAAPPNLQTLLYLVDGNAYFSRPGPRLVDSLEIMAHALHPQIHALPDHLVPAQNLGPAAKLGRG